MNLDDSTTSHGSKEGGYVMTEKTGHDSSATLNPVCYNITQAANDPSELKLMTSQKEISRPSKKALRYKNKIFESVLLIMWLYLL